MKKLVMFFLFATLLTGCLEKEVDISKKQVRNGIVYTVNSDTPFTGTMVGKYSNGQIKIMEEFKNGKYQGEQFYYYENGQIKEKIFYLNGLAEGDYIKYYPNGNVAYTGKYMNGEKEGPWNMYSENNTLLVTQHYDKGKLLKLDQHVVDFDALKAKVQGFFN